MSGNHLRLFFISIIVTTLWSVVFPQPAVENGKFFGQYEIPAETPQPINIDTSKASTVINSTVLLVFQRYDKVDLTNTGRSLELILTQENSESRLIAFADTYKFFKTQFYWTANGRGVAGTTENGKNGAPVEMFMYFYNEKYDSSRNALKYRDGMVSVSVRVEIARQLSNPYFSPFDKNFRNVSEPGTSSQTTLFIASKWFYNFDEESTYYAYPGSYQDEVTENEYFCSTTIILPKSARVLISKEQFRNTFRQLKNSQGEEMSIPYPQNPSDDIPIVSGTQFRHIYL